MRWQILLLFLTVVMCSMEVSSVPLHYTDLFPKCSFYHTEITFSSLAECGTEFFIPNLHLDTGYNLIVKGFTDAIVGAVGTFWNKIVELLLPFMPSTIYDGVVRSNDKIGFIMGYVSIDFLGKQFNILVSLAAVPFWLVFDVMSCVVIYVIILILEFLKTYLFWFIMPVAMWNMAFFCLAQMMHVKHGFVGSFIFNPIVMPILIGAALLIGSIVLISMDWGIFNMRLS
jgi:hypothetical protein